MEQKRSIASFAVAFITLIFILTGLAFCLSFAQWLFPTTAPLAYAESSTAETSAVYQTTMTPWPLSPHADDGSLADYDGAYRQVYNADQVKPSQGHWGPNVEGHIALDDESFWETSNGGVCALDFTFPTSVEFSTIVYGSRLDASLKGFATSFEVYTAQTDGDEWQLIAQGTGTATSQLCSFAVCDPGHSVRAKKVRFTFLASEQNWPSCRTMRFYKRDPHETTLNQIWGDYAKTTFAEGFDGQTVRQLCDRLKNVPGYEVVYAPLVERAEAIINGELTYDPQLERSNQANVPAGQRSSDAIGRWGDVAGYARTTLKFPNNTTNRQPTGLWYRSGETVRIWVSRENPDDPLPRIHWAQPYGYWASWHGGVTQLAEGENILTVPNYKTVAYKTYDIVAGCVAYLENPYTEEEQTGEVKVYFEGAGAYPVYRLGDDIGTYMEQLRLHADKIRADRTSDLDVTELVSDHAMMTVRATQADYLYGARGHDAKQSLSVWEDTLKRVYAFEGIEFDAENPDYDPRNDHLNENYRVSQVWDLGWMFTAGEHIGVYTGDEAENVLIDALDEHGQSRIPGNWGLIHEFGHSIDIPDRTIQETTNNMAANYVATRDAGIIRNQQDIDRANAMADPAYVSGTKFNENRYNFMPFFLVESYWPGWWGRLENLYRDRSVYTEEVQRLPKTERFVYLASLAAGYDLGYWYEKWGLNIDAAKETPFTVDGASDVFHALMERAHFTTKIKSADTIEGVDGALPLWYLDGNEFNFITDHGLEGACAYDDDDEPTIKRVSANGAGYTVTINPMADDDERHLLFEIQGRAADAGEDAWKPLGITYGGTYSDDTEWGDAQPVYRVRAIDRALHHSAYSDPCGPSEAFGVALVEGTPYDTLADAIDAALATETHRVTVVKDCVASTVELTSALTIAAEQNVTIACSGATPAFTVKDRGSLTIEGASEEAPLVFDGEHSKTAKAAIELLNNATLSVRNARFTSWDSNDQGAAIAIASSGAKADVAATTFDHNHALDGAAIANRGTMTVTGCTFTANTADDEGGALRNHSGGVVTLVDCDFIDNHAVHGGGISVDGFTSIRGGEISGNRATYGGGIEELVTASHASRVLALDGSDEGPLSIHDNDGLVGDGVFVARSANAFIADALVDASDGDAIWLESGHLTMNATTDAVAALSPALASGNGLLSSFGTGDSEKSSTVNGTIHNVNGDIVVEDRWPAGDHRYSVEDWGRNGAIVTLDGFDGAEDWETHVRPAGEATPKLIYEAASEEADACVRVAQGGKLTFHLDGGTINAGAIEGYAAGAVTYLPTQVSRTGSSFVGWFDNEALEGASVRSIAADQEGDKEFWAKWATGIYWINYRPNNGTMPEGTQIHRTLGETVKLVVPVRESFEFLGWYENAEFKNQPITTIEANTREGDITVYARWTHGKDKGEVIETQAPTCTTAGYTITVYKCVDCKQEMAYERTEVPALGHQFGEWVTVEGGAVCGGASYEKRTCETCGFVETNGIVDGAHQWGEWSEVQAPTCTVDGMKTRVCERCSVTDYEAIPAAHQFGEPVRDEESAVEATCELPGHYDLVATCATCKETHVVDHVERQALGHAFSELTVIRPNDCAKLQGEIATRTCSTCGLIESVEKECEHHWESTPTTDRKPSCTESGVTSIHCADCGAVKERVETPALGHDFSDPTSDTCLRCDAPNPSYDPTVAPAAPDDPKGDAEENDPSDSMRSVVPGENENPGEGANPSEGGDEGAGGGSSAPDADDPTVGVGGPGGGASGGPIEESVLGLEVVTPTDVSCAPELASLPAGATVPSQGVALAQTGDGRGPLIMGLIVLVLLSGGVIVIGLMTFQRPASRHLVRGKHASHP